MQPFYGNNNNHLKQFLTNQLILYRVFSKTLQLDNEIHNSQRSSTNI